MASENVLTFTEDNFEQEVLQATVPVLVDFWAEWCMPCRMIVPVIEELADGYGERVKVGRIDTDSNRDIAVKYGISAIPTLILFKGGEVAEQITGALPKQKIEEKISPHLT